MSTPMTEVDARFSDEGATATEWDTTLAVLDQAQLFWITTVRADGRPHVTPLVAVWFDGAVYFHTGAEEQKNLNLRANPNVALVTGCNDWDHGLDVVVEGEASLVTDMDLKARVAEAFAVKWDGRWRLTAVADGVAHGDGFVALLYRVTPSKVLAFAKGDFSHTRHRF